jgi:Flp pilus assembly protein TadD
VVAAARRWIADTSAEKPVFVWVHLYDAHQPLPPGPGDPYLAAVARMDAAVGSLVDQLSRRGPPVVLVVGDHGESLGEHGEAEHGFFVYRATTRVPWVLAGPGVDPGRIRSPRSIHDVGPTLLAAVGLPPLDGVDGAPVADTPAPGSVRGETWLPQLSYGLASLRFVEDDPYRWIEAPRPELYDWRADPGETHDLAAALPEVGGKLRAALREPGAARTDAEVREGLAALGYLPGVVLADAGAAIDPKDAVDWPAELARVIVDARTQAPADAVPGLEAYRAKRPSVGAAALLLSTAKELSGDPVGAREALAPLLAASPADPGLRARDAALALAAGDVEAAERIARAVTETRPERPMAWGVLAEIARRRGALAEAEATATQGLAGGDSAQLRIVRAACRRARGDLAGALDDSGAARGLDPASRPVALAHAANLGASGRAAEAVDVLAPWAARAPADAEVAAAYGAGLYEIGRLAEAEAALVVAAPFDRLGAEPAVLLADVLQRRGAPDAEVVAWLIVAERRDPTDGRAARVRAAMLVARGDVRGAMELLGAPTPEE